ncbi:CRISPR-associated exonuclease Cas4 [Caldicoprobacter guelmensis]|uniref:CRISPR-associated protein Cas4 n=1 Tax=Caldicoprobacter guelmensis TaxID=1170224 RepID=UPI001959E785|nr:CRISPR-associated protein Cas4 [Caldicoprobacter guelmensis]MBM7582845.1 CRISPR-associated exonuclease Cas4 [Caldicoprobacter guelmensis]
MVAITGTLVQSYNICKRQTWLMAHQIVPDQDHPYIEIGRLLDEETYSRDKKKISFENVVIDIIRSDEGDIVVGEVKKSSKAQESARLQLAFYLYKLKQNGIDAKGLLLFPEERRRMPVELDSDLEQELEHIFKGINLVVSMSVPPPPQKIGYCKNCGYREFCWA